MKNLIYTAIVDLERFNAWNSGIPVGKTNKVNYKVVLQKVIKKGKQVASNCFRTKSKAKMEGTIYFRVTAVGDTTLVVKQFCLEEDEENWRVYCLQSFQ